MNKEQLDRIVNEIHQNDKDFKISPRNLLEAFNCFKRTKWNVARIDKFLDDNKLETKPSYTDSWVDAEIILRNKKKAKSKNEHDPVQRVMLLPAANRLPLAVQKESMLREAITPTV